MDDRPGALAVDAPEVAAQRIAAATRLLATLRAGRLRVERLAELALPFPALVRVLGGSVEDDDLAQELRRTQELIEVQLSVWRGLREAAPQRVLQSPAAPALAAFQASPEPEPEPAGWLRPPLAEAREAAEAPAPVQAQAPAAAEDDASLTGVVLLPDLELELDEDMLEELPPAEEPTEDRFDQDDAPASEAAELDEDDEAAELAEPDEDAGGFSWAPRPSPAPPAEASGLVDFGEEEFVEEEYQAGESLLEEEPAPIEHDDLEVLVDQLVIEDDDEEDPDEELDLEDEAPVAAVRLPGLPVEKAEPDDELDTLNDDQLTAESIFGLKEPEPSPPPQLAAWLGAEDEEIEQHVTDTPALAPVRSTAEARTAEELGDDDTHEPRAGAVDDEGAQVHAPRAVSPRLVLPLDPDRIMADPDDEGMGQTTFIAPPTTPGNDGHTDELAAVPAMDDFLFEDDSQAVAAKGGGLSVSLERPRRARSEADDEDDGAPRLTDDEPAAAGSSFDDPLKLQPVEEVDEKGVSASLVRARELEAKGDLLGAILHYGDAIDRAPDRRDPFLGRGRAHLELGDYSSAMSDFQRAEDIAPGTPEPLVEMGNLFFARKEYRRAIDYYDQALELDGALAMARCRRGICHHYRRNHKAAFQDLQKAYALDPEIPNIRKYVQMAVKAMERERERR